MPTPVWQPGTIYPPGSLVQPASAPAPQPDPLDNGGFEEGNTGWSMDTGFSIGEFGNNTHFQGTWSLQWDLTGEGRAINAEATEVTPGQTINASCQVQQGASSAGQAGARVEILWYDASDEFLSTSPGNLVNSGRNANWKQSSVSAVAPAGAAFARFAVFAFRNSGGDELWVDNCSWDAVVATLPTGLVFRAVQATAGYSGSSEPVWPLVNGQTVVDNEVTWEAVFASRVVWEASPVLVSGGYEPEWPTIPGGEVADGTIRWVAMDWRIKDEKCPHSAVVQIASSKVYAADGDIIAFSATANCLDWSSEEDAGYLPFGLQTYGKTDCTALGLYRSNLMAFNSEGFQMWQVDEDPANMALLDAAPVPCTFPRTPVPVSNDLVLCTPIGVRNIGIAGASTNLQAGYFGAQIDPLVLAKIRAGGVPFALFWPAMGQYWLIFDEEAFVLTMNGGQKDQSWSRYVFPKAITDWALLDGDLYLRAGDLVWRMDSDVLVDDQVCTPDAPVLSGTAESDFTASLSWTVPDSYWEIVGYRLYNADTDALIVDQPGTTYDSGELDAGSIHRYYVVAYDERGGVSAHSNIVELTMPVTGTIIDVFTESGTWVKRPLLTSVDVVAIGGGGGGAGGGATRGGGNPRSGGGGGGGGRSTANVLAAALGATEAVTVGIGGAGGIAVPRLTNGTNALVAGSAGGSSSFGAHVSAGGGAGANGSTNTTGGVGGTGTQAGGAGGNGNTSSGSGSGDSGTPGTTTALSAAGGGGGGPLDTVAIPGFAAAGGSRGSLVGGAAGTGFAAPNAIGQAGAAGESSTDYTAGAGGGGGGCAGTQSTSALGPALAGNGGDGGLYGGGGGGGGAAQGPSEGVDPDGTATGGNGGNGAPGIVVVINHIG